MPNPEPRKIAFSPLPAIFYRTSVPTPQSLRHSCDAKACNIDALHSPLSFSHLPCHIHLESLILRFCSGNQDITNFLEKAFPRAEELGNVTRDVLIQQFRREFVNSPLMQPRPQRTNRSQEKQVPASTTGMSRFQQQNGRAKVGQSQSLQYAGFFFGVF